MEFTIDMTDTYKRYREMNDSELRGIVRESINHGKAIIENWERNEQRRENIIAGLHPIKRLYHRLADQMRKDPNPYPWYLIVPDFEAMAAEGILKKRDKNGTNKLSTKERLVKNYEETMSGSDFENSQRALHGDDLSEGRVLTNICKYIRAELDGPYGIHNDIRYIREHIVGKAEQIQDSYETPFGLLKRRFSKKARADYDPLKKRISQGIEEIKGLEELRVFLEEIRPLTLAENPLEAITLKVKKYKADANKRGEHLQRDKPDIAYASRLAKFIPSMREQEEKLDGLRKEKYRSDLSKIKRGNS